MKGFELEAVKAAVSEVRPLVRELSDEKRRLVLYGIEAEAPAYDIQEIVDHLTFVQGLELTYRLLGRILDNVSSWRRLLRWAIGKVMELIAGAIKEA